MNDGTPLAEAYELLVDEAMAFERRPSPEAYAVFRKATAASKLAASVPSAAKSRGDASQKLIEHVAGDCPEAWLVDHGAARRAHRSARGVRHRSYARRRHPRRERRGRRAGTPRSSRTRATTGSPTSARRTRRIVNGTTSAARRTSSRPGDVVLVGDVELRYEEKKKL